jgi:hypothetical protein
VDWVDLVDRVDLVDLVDLVDRHRAFPNWWPMPPWSCWRWPAPSSTGSSPLRLMPSKARADLLSAYRVRTDKRKPRP